jgi:hypothetical protein
LALLCGILDDAGFEIGPPIRYHNWGFVLTVLAVLGWHRADWLVLANDAIYLIGSGVFQCMESKAF